MDSVILFMLVGLDFSCTPRYGEHAYRCLSTRLRLIGQHLRAQSPSMLFSGRLIEFLHQDNLDNASQFQDACVPGSIGKWGSNQTCVPDIAHSPVARDYYVHMGKSFLDGGCTLLFFGQARLTGGGVATSSAVSQAGALGFKMVIQALQAYGEAQGTGRIYFGAQAACCIQPAGQGELMDFVYGGIECADQTWPVYGSVYHVLRREIHRL